MRKVLLLVLLAVIGLVAWYFFQTRKTPKEETPNLEPLSVSEASDSFNTSIANVLNHYYSLSEALVNWDSAAANHQSDSLKPLIDSIRFTDLKKDTGIYQTAVTYQSTLKNDVENVALGKDFTAKRRAFNSLSQNFYDLLRTIKYDRQKVYLQLCPMAFNESEPGLWLSKYGADEKRRNPYLGLHDPRYKSAMINCGETKDSLYYK